ncbi:MAG TPA: hypothetical protein VGA37_06270 [Gemmatimonadales bacterium]
MKYAPLLLVSLVLCPVVATAQLIDVKTVPVAAGDQFVLFPSYRLAMGDVSIALDDPLADPFVNPAKGARLRESLLISSPAYYGISGRAGSGLSLPFAALLRSNAWFGGGAVAFQEVRAGDGFFGPVFVEPFDSRITSPIIGETLSERSNSNLYAFGYLGSEARDGRLAVGVSAFVADLNAVDGVDLLYAMSENLVQFGYMADVRAGLSADLGKARSFEATVLHHRLSMTHEVTYVDWIVIDSTQWLVEPRGRFERNLDRTNTWGTHLGYTQPLGDTWRIGAALTANRKSHPKIPNYEIMNIPRDPGTTWAYNIGIGVARTNGPSTFGLDLVYEPIRSHTWAEADGPVTSATGVIPSGGKTVDNRFRFSNVHMRSGIAREVGQVTLQLGVQARSIDYRLRQADFVEGTNRRTHEHWVEWMPSWGVRVHLSDLELQYVGRVTTGTGRPGVAWGGDARASMEAAAAADILIAPSGPLTLQDSHVTTHQLMVSMPIR